MSAGWDELGPGGHPSRAVDRGAWSEELARLDAAAARRLEADALADEVAARAGRLRWWAGMAVGLAAAGLLLWVSLRTGG